MAPDGRFIMLDRYGAVKEAQEQGGQLVLAPQPIAHLGPGRPLGAQFDTAGNLIICDAFKVRMPMCRLRTRVGRQMEHANETSRAVRASCNGSDAARCIEARCATPALSNSIKSTLHSRGLLSKLPLPAIVPLLLPLPHYRGSSC
jgi:hypothetical protein